MQAILALPHITGSQPAKIHDFYEKLLSNVQALETLGKLKEISGYVPMTIDKLEGIRGDLVIWETIASRNRFPTNVTKEKE